MELLNRGTLDIITTLLYYCYRLNLFVLLLRNLLRYLELHF